MTDHLLLRNLNISFSFPLSQSSKVLAKHELLKVPLIGWTWYFLEIVFCKRKWEEDRETVLKGLDQLRDYPEPMWVSVFESVILRQWAHVRHVLL